MSSPFDRIRVLIADDHPIFLEGFCTVVAARYPELEVIAAVNDGPSAVEAAASLNPDVILLDIQMPKLNGIEVARQIRARRPDAKIIMLTTYDQPELIAGAFDAGAMGYIMKDKPIAEVVVDIKVVNQGNLLMNANVAARAGWRGRRTEDPLETEGTKELEKFLAQMTKREADVFRLIAKGKTNTEIAEQLAIGEGTVRNYVSHIYEILGVHNRTAVIIWAFEHPQK